MRQTNNDPSLSTSSSKEVEVFPGVFHRRFFLKGSLTSAAIALAVGVLPKKLLAQEAARAPVVGGAEKLGWDDFLKQAVPVAQQLKADPAFSIDEYLYRIGSLATRLKELPDSKLGPYTDVEPRVSFGPSFRGSPFFIIQWRMEPGAFLPPHNHPNASVCAATYLLENQGDLKTALEDTDHSIRLEERFENLMTKSQILNALERKAEASTARDKALSLASTLQLHNYGMGLISEGRRDEAFEIFKVNVEKHPDTLIAHIELARIASGRGDFEEAIKEVNAAMKIAPDATKPNLANLLHRLQNREDINK